MGRSVVNQSVVNHAFFEHDVKTRSRFVSSVGPPGALGRWSGALTVKITTLRSP